MLVAISAGCGSSPNASTSGCGPEIRESQAADSGVHVIASAPVTYASEPPTSGPHAPGPEIGTYDRTLTYPEQVGVLERGDIVVQYDRALTGPDQVADIIATAGTSAVVFGADDLDRQVVMTAWRVRQSCDVVDTAAIAAFINAHRTELDLHGAGS